MEDPLEVLIKRICDKDPVLTPQELEKEIAHCVGMKINDLIKQTVTAGHIELLQQVIRETFDLSCEVTPALSLYVNISNASSQKTSIESFSSLPFEQALAAITEKNFSLISSEEILDSVNKVVNRASELFIHSVLLSHPMLMKIFQRFMETFHEQLNVMLRDPIMIFMQSQDVPKETEVENKSHPGTYL